MDAKKKIIRNRFGINLILFFPIVFTPYFKSLIEKEFNLSSWSAFFIFMGLWTIWFIVLARFLKPKSN